MRERAGKPIDPHGVALGLEVGHDRLVSREPVTRKRWKLDLEVQDG